MTRRFLHWAAASDSPLAMFILIAGVFAAGTAIMAVAHFAPVLIPFMVAGTYLAARSRGRAIEIERRDP